MKKTILEWLEELPEPYRSQAIENCQNSHPLSGHEIRRDIASALIAAFAWAYTKEDHDYWDTLYTKLINDK